MSIQDIKAGALKEFNEEKAKDAKERIKKKLRELANAKTNVKNIEREIEDLEHEISQDI